jgi:hypothetical protein
MPNSPHFRREITQFFTVILLSTLFLSCKKEDVYSDAIFGKWSFQEVLCIGNYKDSTIALSGTFDFMPSEEIGQSGYGGFAKADANIPEWKLAGIVLKPETLYLGEPLEKRTYNYKSTFHGYYARKVSSSTYETIVLDMHMVSKNELHVFLANNNSLTSHRFNLFRITLTR